VRWIEVGARIGARRGETVVCIPVHGGHEHFVRCLGSVLAHTPSQVPIVICDDASPDPRSRRHVHKLERRDLGPRELLYVRHERNLGFPANVNEAFASAAPADVVVLNSDCVVAAGWLEGLRGAAYSHSAVATATALTNHGTIVSVPERGVPAPELPEGWSLDDAAAAVRRTSQRLRPRLLTAVGHCVYVRRSALELVGGFDLAFSPGYGEEVDFSQRALHNGLCHVAADDVLVLHHGGGSFAPDGVAAAVQGEHELMLVRRYPYYHDAVRAVERDQGGPLARCIGTARRALKGLSVLVDARALGEGGPVTGIQLGVIALIAALERTGEARVSALVPGHLSGWARDALEGLSGVERVSIPSGALDASARADVFHRPGEISSHADLSLAAALGERLIITQPDLSAYANPSYFPSFEAWADHRSLIRDSLAAADRVIFASGCVRADALAEDLLEPDRADVLRDGVDHVLSYADIPACPPRWAGRLPEGPEMMLCLGGDVRHENRVFALRVAQALQVRHDWRGRLLLAGPRVAHGSTAADEARLVAESPRLADAVLELGDCSATEQSWLLRRAGLLVHPRVDGALASAPFAAAEHGVPCLFAPGGGLGEILPEELAGIVPWDADLSADRALELLGDERARQPNVSALCAGAAGLTWQRAAARLLELYRAVCDQRPARGGEVLEPHPGLAPPGEPSAPPGEAPAPPDPTPGPQPVALGEDAMRLVGPGGALPVEAQRPLLALATHAQLGVPVFGAIKLGYRISHRLRRRATREGPRERS